MKKELEVKILEIDEPRMRRALTNLDGRLVFDGALRTATYDIADSDGEPFYLTNSGDGAGLLVLADNRRGELLHAAVTDHTETSEILSMMGLENHGQMWRVTRKFFRLDSKGYRLRLRQLVDEKRGIDLGQLTLKTDKRADTIKRMNEYETDLTPYLTARKMLLRFGMREYRAYEKLRAEYHLRGGVKVVIDTIPDVPTFLEIEGPDDESIAATVTQLGYGMDDTCTLTGREVRARYNR